MEFGELVTIPEGGGHDASSCPFCPVDKKKRDLTSHVGKDNSSKTLGGRLEASGDKKANHLYVDSEYGSYSAEAHHAICGNEVLAEEKELERFLLMQGHATTKGQDGLLAPNDVGYDVNCAKNGIWLPSVPFRFMAGKKTPERWWGDQSTWNETKRKPRARRRASLTEEEKTEIAFTVMAEVKRQFHKGPHGAVGEPHNNYVVMAINRLRQLTVYVKHFAKVCPMDEGKPKTEPPFCPPYGVVPRLDALSENLKRELKGPPETWNYFISAFALECAAHWKAERALDSVNAV